VLNAAIPDFESKMISALSQSPVTTPSLRLAVFGDAGNTYTNGTSFYYSPGAYRRYDLGSSGPLQQAVAEMMRSWLPSDVFQLGDESYNVNSSSLLDINIGQYYNNWIYPYAPPAYTQAGSIYADGELGGIPAVQGRTQWPYNLYNYPWDFQILQIPASLVAAPMASTTILPCLAIMMKQPSWGPIMMRA
jgi:hypothetical protein